MAGLKLQAVTKSWDGKTQVIKPLTLDVADGEFIVMVGPSGCGWTVRNKNGWFKTTGSNQKLGRQNPGD